MAGRGQKQYKNEYTTPNQTPVIQTPLLNSSVIGLATPPQVEAQKPLEEMKNAFRTNSEDDWDHIDEASIKVEQASGEAMQRF
jgi:hypothetical protein